MLARKPASTGAHFTREGNKLPKLTEAAVLVAGQIIDLQTSEDFTTKAVDGVKVLIATGDGYATVKLKTETSLNIKPTTGMSVTWLVRFGANGGGDRAASLYSAFVREANSGDLDRILSLSKVK